MIKTSYEQDIIDNDAFDWLCKISDAYKSGNESKTKKNIEQSTQWLDSVLNPAGEYVAISKYKLKKAQKLKEGVCDE